MKVTIYNTSGLETQNDDLERQWSFRAGVDPVSASLARLLPAPGDFGMLPDGRTSPNRILEIIRDGERRRFTRVSLVVRFGLSVWAWQDDLGRLYESAFETGYRASVEIAGYKRKHPAMKVRKRVRAKKGAVPVFSQQELGL